MRVLINAQMLPGGLGGGTEQFLMGLVYGLGRANDGPEEYILIGHWKDTEWLRPYLGPNQKIVFGKPDRREQVKQLLGPMLVPVRMARRGLRRLLSGRPCSTASVVPDSNGFYESFGAEVIHFPFQIFARCTIPAIYNPHDLQHLHFPEFFSEEQIACRETSYREGCQRARAVVAESKAVKDDLVQLYGLQPDKVTVIPRGAPTTLYDPPSQALLDHVRQKYALAHQFVLYPGQTWPHKNHLRLLEAIHRLRERHGVRLNVVCTGRKNDFWPTIEAQLARLKLAEQVFFPGYVSGSELRALYHACEFVVFPSLFEGGGFPIVEAFQEGAPVACSAIPPLQEYGGDAVFMFDPSSVESIVQALVRLFSDSKLRATLTSRGGERATLFSWERTGRMYRALYRRVAGRALSQEDQQLLTENLRTLVLDSAVFWTECAHK
jgi:glycosyltransferase involved in cell wall biosynthesis